MRGSERSSATRARVRALVRHPLALDDERARAPTLLLCMLWPVLVRSALRQLTERRDLGQDRARTAPSGSAGSRTRGPSRATPAGRQAARCTPDRSHALRDCIGNNGKPLRALPGSGEAVSEGALLAASAAPHRRVPSRLGRRRAESSRRRTRRRCARVGDRLHIHRRVIRASPKRKVRRSLGRRTCSETVTRLLSCGHDAASDRGDDQRAGGRDRAQRVRWRGLRSPWRSGRPACVAARLALLRITPSRARCSGQLLGGPAPSRRWRHGAEPTMRRGRRSSLVRC